MLTPINTDMLAALESELARVRAQRDALSDALATIANAIHKSQPSSEPSPSEADLLLVGAEIVARNALQACQD